MKDYRRSWPFGGLWRRYRYRGVHRRNRFSLTVVEVQVEEVGRAAIQLIEVIEGAGVEFDSSTGVWTVRITRGAPGL